MIPTGFFLLWRPPQRRMPRRISVGAPGESMKIFLNIFTILSEIFWEDVLEHFLEYLEESLEKTLQEILVKFLQGSLESLEGLLVLVRIPRIIRRIRDRSRDCWRNLRKNFRRYSSNKIGVPGRIPVGISRKVSGLTSKGSRESNPVWIQYCRNFWMNPRRIPWKNPFFLFSGWNSCRKSWKNHRRISEKKNPGWIPTRIPGRIPEEIPWGNLGGIPGKSQIQIMELYQYR